MRLALLLLTLLTMASIAAPASEAEDLTVAVDWEPRECGRVVLEPPGGIYGYGAVLTAYAEASENCRFSMWVSDLPGLNNTVTNPLTLTALSNAYLKAVFVKVGGAVTTTAAATGGEYALLKITANVSSFSGEVKVVRRGEEVWVSAPREIFLNETARYVFVGYGGGVEKATDDPVLKVLVEGDIVLVALYRLWMKFLDVWYPAGEFTYYHAPVIEAGRGARLAPRSLKLSFANLTLTLETPIPREFIYRVEPAYVKEYSLSVRCIGCGEVSLLLNGRRMKASDYLSEWFEENSTVELRVLDEETPTAWVKSPGKVRMVMDGPKEVAVECEAKPHGWAYGSPIYGVLDLIVKQFRSTGLYPIVSNVTSSPQTAYGLLGAAAAALAGLAYGAALLLRRAPMMGGGVKASIEKYLMSKSSEEFLEALPRAVSPREREFEIAEAPFPDIYIPLWNPGPAPLEEPEAGEAAGSGEKPADHVGMSAVLEGVERGEVDSGALLEALAESPPLSRLVLERRPRLVGEPRAPEVEKALEKVERNGGVVVSGGDPHMRRWVVEGLGLECEYLEGAPVRSLEEAVKVVEKARKLIVLGEDVDGESFRNIYYAARLAGKPVVKLSIEPLEGLENVEVSAPTVRRLLGYIVYRSLRSGRPITLDDAVELARAAGATRGYATVDRYFEGEADLNKLYLEEFGKAYDDVEAKALAKWKATGRIDEALKYFRNASSQIDPTGYFMKVKAFEEKVEKLAKLSWELEEVMKLIAGPARWKDGKMLEGLLREGGEVGELEEFEELDGEGG